MKIKNICIITDGYPSDTSMKNAFVEQLINEFTNLDINCYVIAPQSLTKIIVRREPVNKKRYNRICENGKEVEVYSPLYLSFSNIKKIINTNILNLYFFGEQCRRIFSKLSKNIHFDVIYSHFLFPSAIIANKIGKKYNVPVFVAYGENTSYTIDYLGKEKTKKYLEGIKGVISVSESNKQRLIDYGLFENNLIKVFPNGINKNIFYQKNKALIRKKLNISDDDFIVAFVGRFEKVKGIDRLCSALNLINNNSIKAIFIGQGSLKPTYKNIVFKGQLDHKDIADYLSASDIFALPTTAEGCCNAIIEAIACGLPVISSKESFNDEILDDLCSIRIDTMNVLEIKNAIEMLYYNKEKREKYSKHAVQKSKEFDIQSRAKNIINYMESK